jgi:hypothetical protein
VLLHEYDRVRTTTGCEETSFVGPIADALFVGGGSGVALYATHYALSAVVYGAIGYVATGIVVLMASNSAIYSSE